MDKPNFLIDNVGNSYSAYPPTTYLTFAYWIFMVPQYKPKNVLILGYAGGTIAGLIKLLYGDIPITGVDIADCPNYYNVELIKADANEFVKTCGQYDAVIVDCFARDFSSTPCDFVTSKEFVQNLKRIGNYLIINTLHAKDMSAYEGLQKIGENKAPGSAERIFYYMVNPIPNLHPFKK